MVTALRRRLKYALYRRLGHFLYFGERLYFPPDSAVFRMACEQGIYEHDILRLLRFAIRPGTWYFDVGANIGLLSAPLLHAEPNLTVVSVDASPISASCLAVSVAESSQRARWHVVTKAFGDHQGQVDFHASAAAGGAFDGLRHTGRVAGGSSVPVIMTTLDHVWQEYGAPPVCLIKIDVEGAEPQVLRGARACLAATRPIIMLECNPINLAAYQQDPGDVFAVARDLDYDVLSTPSLAPVPTARAMAFHCRVSENFLLLPRA